MGIKEHFNNLVWNLASKTPEIPGRRLILLTPLLILASSCIKLGPSEVIKPNYIPIFSKEIRPGIRFNFNGGSLYNYDPSKNQLPNPEFSQLKEGGSLVKYIFTPETNISFAVFTINPERTIDLGVFAKDTYLKVKDVLGKWANEAGITPKPFKPIKGSHSITFSSSVLGLDTIHPYIPFCFFGDNDFKEFINAATIGKRNIMPVDKGELALTLLNQNLINSDSLIAINLAGRDIEIERFKQIGITLSLTEMTELALVNEYGGLFFEEMRRNDPTTFTKFLTTLKMKFDFPPENNELFDSEISKIAKTRRITVSEALLIVTREALTTYLTFEYMSRILKK